MIRRNVFGVEPFDKQIITLNFEKRCVSLSMVKLKRLK